MMQDLLWLTKGIVKLTTAYLLFCLIIILFS